MSGIVDFVTSLFKQPEYKQVSAISPEEKQFLDLINQAVSGTGPLAGLGQYNPAETASRFNQAVAQPLITQFNEEILPGITGQFRGAGLGRSTFAGQAAARAGEGLERQLSSGLAQYQTSQQNQANQNLLNLLNLYLGKEQTALQAPQPSTAEKALLASILAAGQAGARKA